MADRSAALRQQPSVRSAAPKDRNDEKQKPSGSALASIDTTLLVNRKKEGEASRQKAINAPSQANQNVQNQAKAEEREQTRPYVAPRHIQKQKKPQRKTPEQIEAEKRQRAKDIRENKKSITYSNFYSDDDYVYRHVKLPLMISRWLPHLNLLKEEEWRFLGVELSSAWEHYMVHAPEPHILLFRRKIPEDEREIDREEDERIAALERARELEERECEEVPAPEAGPAQAPPQAPKRRRV